MKKLEAILRPYHQEDILKTLMEMDIGGATFVEARGFGKQRGHTEIHRGSEYTLDLLPKIMMIVYLNDDRVDEVVRMIVKIARTGKIGDGKIVISDVENVVRIRTGEQDSDAL